MLQPIQVQYLVLGTVKEELWNLSWACVCVYYIFCKGKGKPFLEITGVQFLQIELKPMGLLKKVAPLNTSKHRRWILELGLFAEESNLGGVLKKKKYNILQNILSSFHIKKKIKILTDPV